MLALPLSFNVHHLHKKNDILGTTYFQTTKVWPAAHFMFITTKTKVKVTDKNLHRGALTNPK